MIRNGIIATLLALLSMVSFAQTNCEQGNGQLDSEYPSGITPEKIVEKFAANEAMLEKVRAQYSFKQEIKIQTFFQRTMDGEYRQIAEVSFDEKGRRLEHVTFAPVSTLRRISISPEDLEDIRISGGFLLTPSAMKEYRVDYVGQQPVDELSTYVFDVAPSAMRPNARYFKGRLWVDTRDFQVVKSCGKSVPDVVRNSRGKRGSEENITPTIVTYRQLVEGRYWLPAYSRSDDVLMFSRQVVPIKEVIKYTEYKKSGTADEAHSAAR